MSELTCLLCEHLIWEQATPAFSEWTPGGNMDIYCERKHWRLDRYEDTQDEFRGYMLSANNCKDFEKRKIEEA